MGVRPLDRENLGHYSGRVRAVGAQSERRWGTMTPAKVHAHLRRNLCISLGEVGVPDESNWLTRSPLFLWFAIHVMPWPGGKLKSPARYNPEAEGDVDHERRELLAAMDRFVAALEADPDRPGLSQRFGLHPLTRWAHLHGKHFDHHLRQFGA